MAYGTLTPTTSEEAKRGQQQPRLATRTVPLQHSPVGPTDSLIETTNNAARSKRPHQGHSRTPTGADKRRNDLQTRKKTQRQSAKQETRMPSPQPGSGNSDTVVINEKPTTRTPSPQPGSGNSVTVVINEEPTNQTEQWQTYPDTEKSPKN